MHTAMHSDDSTDSSSDTSSAGEFGEGISSPSSSLKPQKRRRFCGVEFGNHPVTSGLFQDKLGWAASRADACFAAKRADRALGAGCQVTEGHIRSLYEGTAHEDQADAVVLLLRLSLALAAFGHNCTDAEGIIRDICRNWRLSGVVVFFELERCSFSFAGLPAHTLNLSRGIHADKLAAVTKMATYLSSGPALVNLQACSVVLDQILEEPDPYAKWFQIFSFQGLCMCAAICAFSGRYVDVLAAGICAPILTLTLEVSQYVKAFRRAEGVLIPTMLGLVVPLVWRYVLPAPPCRVVSWYLSCLLVFLPGSQLVYGAYEVGGGSILTGGGRLLGAIVRCMFLALGLSLGWQAFGHDAATPYISKSGAIASIPPRLACEGDMAEPIPWQMVFGVYNIPMLFFGLVGLNCRIHTMFGPLFVAYVTLLCFRSLRAWNQLPPTMVNIISVYLVGTLGALYEYITTTPKQVAIIPVVLILAPGAGAVGDVLEGLHSSVYDMGPSSHMWAGLVLESTSYAFGLFLAQAFWRSLIQRRSRKWAAKPSISSSDLPNYNEFTHRI